MHDGVGVDDKLSVNADFAIFIDNDGDPLVSALRQDAVQQGRFACPEKAGQDRRLYLGHASFPFAVGHALAMQAGARVVIGSFVFSVC